MDMTKAEEDINRTLKQLLPHHIKSKTQHVDEYTKVEELRRIYYELLEFAQTKCPSLSPANMYHLRRQIINGICKTEAAWRGLVAVLNLRELSAKDMPVFAHPRAHVDPTATHVFRGTFGVRMPYIGGGSVVFSVAPSTSSNGSSSSSGMY